MVTVVCVLVVTVVAAPVAVRWKVFWMYGASGGGGGGTPANGNLGNEFAGGATLVVFACFVGLVPGSGPPPEEAAPEAPSARSITVEDCAPDANCTIHSQLNADLKKHVLILKANAICIYKVFWNSSRGVRQRRRQEGVRSRVGGSARSGENVVGFREATWGEV